MILNFRPIFINGLETYKINTPMTGHALSNGVCYILRCNFLIKHIGTYQTIISNKCSTFCLDHNQEVIICENDYITNLSKTWGVMGNGVIKLVYNQRLYWFDKNGINVFENGKVITNSIQWEKYRTYGKWLLVSLDNQTFINKPFKWLLSNNHIYSIKKRIKTWTIYYSLKDKLLNELIFMILELTNNMSISCY
jgi:hypothetical protein